MSNYSAGPPANCARTARSVGRVKTLIPIKLWRAARLLLGAGAALGFLASAHASVRWATLEAIHQLENPRNSARPGPCGELGAYQFRAMTWQMYTTTPFERALDRAASDVVAVKHYEWIKAGLERAGVPATPYFIGLAWNGGLAAALNGRAPRAARDYAERVANLTEVLNGGTVASLR